MRNAFADVIYELGKVDKRIVIVVADISPAGSISKFREEFPQRFVNTGVSEQIMIGMSAGLSLRGLRPFAYTIATFALYRPFEFVRDDLCYHNLPVTVVGVGGGVNYSTLGATHHAQEDVSVACAIPGLNVIAPCDPAEVAAATRWCATQELGPVYLRLGKAGEPFLTKGAAEPWEFGRLRQIFSGEEVCILSYGPVLKLGLGIAKRFVAKGQNPALFSVHTLKPLDIERLRQILQQFSHIIIIEECVEIGGLSMQVRNLASRLQLSRRIDSFNLQDAFIHRYGTHDDVLAAHGLSEDKIWTSVAAKDSTARTVP